MSIFPPPRVGGIEFELSDIGLGSWENATPIIPMNGRSGNRTRLELPTGITPLPSSIAVNTDTLPRSVGSGLSRSSVLTGGITSAKAIPAGGPPSLPRARAPSRVGSTPPRRAPAESLRASQF